MDSPEFSGKWEDPGAFPVVGWLEGGLFGLFLFLTFSLFLCFYIFCGCASLRGGDGGFRARAGDHGGVFGEVCGHSDDEMGSLLFVVCIIGADEVSGGSMTGVVLSLISWVYISVGLL